MPILYAIQLLLLCSSAFVYSRSIIVTHGSFAHDASWYQEKGDFYTTLIDQAIIYNYNVESFCWSGTPCYISIYKAAKKMAKLLHRHESNEFILIGHSNGGNVILLATQLLKKMLNKNQTKQQNVPSQKKSFFKTTHELLHRYFINPYSKEQHRSNLVHAKNIKAIVLLGTPIIQQLFYPDTSLVKTIWNLYSPNDHIQSLGGICSKTLNIPNISYNFAINIKHNATMQSLNHSQVHDPIIGSWLIHLCELIPPHMINGTTLCFSNTEIPWIE